MDIETFVKSGFSSLGATELLNAPVDALHGTTTAQAQALREVLGITTVFDLAASQLLHLLRSTLASASPRLPGDVFDAAAAGDAALASAPLAALRGVGADGAARLLAALGVATLGELAAWPPGIAARDLLSAACLPEQALGFDPEAPDDLLPRLGEHATDKVFYRTLVIDGGAEPGDGGGAAAIETAEPLDLGGVLGGNAQFRRVATGALLSFSQSWFAQGLALGQLLHSLSLAPGESTRMAMIDWSRQSLGRGSEAVNDSERLVNTTTHQRALSEVTEATAREVQTGRTKATATSSTSQDGSALGFEIGPLAFGSSGGSSSTRTEAMTASRSFGRRDLASSTQQQINDISQQEASAARSRRASVVRELSQNEHEALSTRVIANYNHMHTLNVQYYEVVQAFRVTTRLERADRVIFVPIALIDFNDTGNIERFRAQLASAALDEATRQRIALFGQVLVRSRRQRRIRALDGRFVPTLSLAPASQALPEAAVGAATAAPAPAPAAAAAPAPSPAPAPAPSPATPPPAVPGPRVGLLQRFSADGWDAEELRTLVRIGVRPLATRLETALALPADTLVSAVVLPSDLALAIEVTRRDGSIVPLVNPGPAGARFIAPEAVRELSSISVRSTRIVPIETTLTLQLNLQGTVTPMSVPVTLQAGGPLSALQRAVSFDPPPEQDELLVHLKANALHYTQAVMRTLDESVISALLARLSFGGVPLAQWVDHQPVAVTANYLVFKAGLPDRGDPPDPSLAELTRTWQQFLATAGLVNVPPRRELMTLPTGGVFAEAVLGRSVGAERLDSTRFFDWQESPIPLVASEIAPLEAGSRASDEDLVPTGLSAPIVNIQAPTALPDPTGLGAVLGALGAQNLFRDLTGADATLSLAKALQSVSAAGATSGGALAAQTLKTVMEQNTERMRVAAKVAAAMAGVPPVGADGKKTDGKASNTVAGGLENRAKEIDQSVAKAPAQGGGPRPSATELQQRQSGSTAQNTAQQIVDAVSGAAEQSEGLSAPAKAAPAQAGPRQIQVVLGSSAVLADGSLFDNAPVPLSIRIQERDGTQILRKGGIAGGGAQTMGLSSASPTLFANVDITIDTGFPVPTRLLTNRFAHIDMAQVRNTLRLDLVVEVKFREQRIDTGATAPSDSAIAGALSKAGIDLRTVLKKPEVTNGPAGDFFVRFPFLASMRLEFTPD